MHSSQAAARRGSDRCRAQVNGKQKLVPHNFVELQFARRIGEKMFKRKFWITPFVPTPLGWS